MASYILSARTQPKVDQFEVKQRLRQLLKLRSTFSKKSDKDKDTKAKLDQEIQDLYSYLQTNKDMLKHAKVRH